MAAPSAWTPTTATRGAITAGTIKTGDSWKMALFTSSWSTSTTTYSATNEVSSTNTGYTTAGAAVALTQSGTTTETIVMTTAPVWTAGTANLTARFAVIYSTTDGSKTILCYCTLDSTPADVTATNGNALTIGSNGGTIYTLS